MSKSLTWFALLGLIASCGIKWIPVAKVGGLSLEIHNFFAIFSAILAFGLILLRGKAVLPREIFLIVVVEVLVAIWAPIFGNSIPGFVFESLPVVFASFLFFQVRFSPYEDLGKINFIAVSFLIFSLFFSAASAGLNLFQEIFTYFTTLNTYRFTFVVLRSIYNAFSSSMAVTGQVEYSAALSNALAAQAYIIASIALSFLMSGRHVILNVAITLFGFFVIFVTFSMATLVSVAVAGLLVYFSLLRMNSNRVARFFGVLVPLICVPFVLYALSDFISVALDSNASSASTRENQYYMALLSIAESPVLGGGAVSEGGHSVHNFFLTAWTGGGIIAAFSVGLLYSICATIVLKGLRALQSADASIRFLGGLMVMLPLLFVSRTMFGGGGGFPSSAEMVALSLAILARGAYRQRARRAASQGESPELNPSAIKNGGASSHAIG